MFALHTDLLPNEHMANMTSRVTARERVGGCRGEGGQTGCDASESAERGGHLASYANALGQHGTRSTTCFSGYINRIRLISARTPDSPFGDISLTLRAQQSRRRRHVERASPPPSSSTSTHLIHPPTHPSHHPSSLGKKRTGCSSEFAYSVFCLYGLNSLGLFSALCCYFNAHQRIHGVF